MSVLGRAAREELKLAGISVRDYIAWVSWVDAGWHGDRCGCTDDRCIGYHHDETDECRCLPVLIQHFWEDAHKPQNMA